ncbi:hypothetical protein PseudUWO311_03345 [Pseudanabaena sp. UWO311]|uniref:hypothetical protein n=1 Tax=Pseudanabaena sp. UWO311 TaxID=2487337 RepID=UPI0011584D50|nr:hypothetical protein [Pseudanabaena sp. UWO311]TYQ29178.1 hypothetical protein PseudUWO311_03345 [Pseudanabaena sp. UWO311]
MGRYPKSCNEVLAEIEARHKIFVDSGWQPLVIDSQSILYRLVMRDRIDTNTNKPTPSDFDNFGLSVYVDSPDFPAIDITEILANNSKFVAVVSIPASFMIELGFEIIHDPHPSRTGEAQHSNHAQVICKKTQGKKNQIRDKCNWVICPDLSSFN